MADDIEGTVPVTFIDDPNRPPFSFLALAGTCFQCAQACYYFDSASYFVANDAAQFAMHDVRLLHRRCSKFGDDGCGELLCTRCDEYNSNFATEDFSTVWEVCGCGALTTQEGCFGSEVPGFHSSFVPWT